MPNTRPVVVIDPGHGGHARVEGSAPNNAAGPNGLLEKNLTLDLAGRVAPLLANQAQVILTRTSDTNLGLAARARIARDNNAALFLSIHLNGWHDPQVDGTTLYVARHPSQLSRNLAQTVADRLSAVTRVTNRGVHQKDFGVLVPGRHASHTGACLVEVAFLTNPQQAQRLQQEAYRQQLAEAMAEAIRQHLYVPATAAQSWAAAIGGYGAERHFPSPLRPQAGTLGSRIRFVLNRSVGRGGVNNGDDVHALKERLIELGFNWLRLNRTMDADTTRAIKLFQSIISGRNTLSGDGRVDVPGTTHRWLQASNAPRWQLMPVGSAVEGFNNVERADPKDTHDFGTNWMADTIKAASADYRETYLASHSSAALMTVNDVSLPRGGNTPDHAGHETGLACDLRLPRKDGTAPGNTKHIDTAIYDQNATRAMLQAWRRQPLVTRILFNDPVLIGERLCIRSKGHDDHFHVEIQPPTQGGIELIDVGDRVTAAAGYAATYEGIQSFNTAASGLAEGNQTDFQCGSGSSLSLHQDLINGVTGTRQLAGENLNLARPVCAATRICPAGFQTFHSTGDATHFVSLDRNAIRIAELAGLFGVNLATITGGSRIATKASKAAKTIASNAPLANLSFVALRRDSKREIHIHRGNGRTLTSLVDGRIWKCLPFEATPGNAYTLFKRRWFEASLHRQWGREAAIAWIKGLCNFYLDQTRLRLGVGDISHVVGEDMTDHASHEQGRDVDLYVLDYSANSTHPEAYWCEGNSIRNLGLKTMAPPTTTRKEYDPNGGTALTGAREQEIFRRYATVLAYCLATWDKLTTLTWHGVTAIADQALAIAQAAFDSGWQNRWGNSPSRREDIETAWRQRNQKLVGQGSSNYGVGRGWPPHQDHMHLRLNV